jgi:hypothetical protein
MGHAGPNPHSIRRAPIGRRTGKPALSPAASAPAAFSAAVVNGSSGMLAESPWFPPMPASPDGINSKKRAYYPTSRRIAQEGISKKWGKNGDSPQMTQCF